MSLAVAMACRALLFSALIVLAAAQLPNLRVGLPPDTDANKRLDMQSGYPLVVSLCLQFRVYAVELG
jgi:hypothetical protein